MRFSKSAALVRSAFNHSNSSDAKKPGGENSFSPRVEVIDWNYEKLRSRYRDIGKLVFLFLRGRLFLGGLLSFFLSCHID
jgi:hypothetical protein